MAERKHASLAEMIRGSVGEASIAAMDAAAAVPGERTIETITSEIVQLKADAGNAIIGIGQRLIEAKDLLPHGEWLDWLSDRVEFSERTAQDFMRLAREWTNPQTLADFGKAKALKLLLLPPSEREDFMSAHDVPNMSTRELDEAIRRQKELERERDEAQAAAADAERHLAEARESALTSAQQRDAIGAELADVKDDLAHAERQRDEAEARIRELEDAPKELYRDESAIKSAADEARHAAEAEWSAKLKAAEDKLARAKEDAKKAAEKAEKAAKSEVDAARADAESANETAASVMAEVAELRAQLEQARREARQSGDADLSTFRVLFESVQSEINKMRGLLLKVRGREDGELGEKLTAALLALAEAVKECAA